MYKKFLFITLSCFYLTNHALASSNITTPEPSATEKQISPNNAQAEISNALEFINPWARASMSPNNNSAVYLVIKNNSNDDYTLTGASAIDVANNVELHQTIVDNKGVSKMIAVDKIVIPARSEITLKPGGMHIMLFDLKRSLTNNDKFTINLKFEKIGIKTVEVEVKADN